MSVKLKGYKTIIEFNYDKLEIPDLAPIANLIPKELIEENPLPEPDNIEYYKELIPNKEIK